VLVGLKVTFFGLQLLQWLGYASLRLAMQTNCSSKKVPLLILITQYTIFCHVKKQCLLQLASDEKMSRFFDGCRKNMFFFKRPEIMTLSCCIDNAKVSLHCHGI
jgi:hypothetical protein